MKRTTFLIAAGMLSLPAAIHAGTLRVNIGHPLAAGSCFTPDSVSGPIGPVHDTQTCSEPGLGIQGLALGAADYGLLQASLELKSFVDPLISIENTGVTEVSFEGTYVFTGPGAFATTRLNLDISGVLEAAGVRSASATMSLIVDLAGTRRNGVRVLGNDLSVGAPWPSLGASGGGSSSFETEDYTVPLNTPVTLLVDLAAGGGILSGGKISSNFGSTLTFAKEGNVFSLPSDIQVNGDGVVNNAWIGAAGAVPEPGAWLLMGLGLAFIMAIRRGTPYSL
jgi:hypothetical protein